MIGLGEGKEKKKKKNRGKKFDPKCVWGIKRSIAADFYTAAVDCHKRLYLLRQSNSSLQYISYIGAVQKSAVICDI